MVNSITSLTRSGLKDWYFQRISAVLMLFYVAFWVGFWIAYPHPTFMIWSTLFGLWWMKIATFAVIIFLILHAWIGLWTVLTDYLKCSALRFVLQTLIMLGFLACIVWAAVILWS